MYKKILAKAIFILGTVTAVNTFAGEWLTDIKIKNIEVQPNGNAYIETDEAVPNLGCAGNGYYVQFDTDSPLFKEQYSLVLTAYMSNKNIRVYVNGCGYYPYAQNTRFE